MAGLKCRCGNILNNVNCPSKDIILIFDEKEVQDGITKGATLFDFECEQMDHERQYWYCHNCGRVYIDYGGYYGYFEATYQRNLNGSFPVYLEVSNWRHLYVFTDKEVDDATEQDINTPLSEFMIKRKRECVISEDKMQAFLYDAATHAPLSAYSLEWKNPDHEIGI